MEFMKRFSILGLGWLLITGVANGAHSSDPDSAPSLQNSVVKISPPPAIPIP
jgi:hypothetical protein